MRLCKLTELYNLIRIEFGRLECVGEPLPLTRIFREIAFELLGYSDVRATMLHTWVFNKGDHALCSPVDGL